MYLGYALHMRPYTYTYVLYHGLFLPTVPVIFFQQSSYTVTEDAGTLAVVVSSNEEHFRPINFSIFTTSDSAIGNDYSRLYGVF